MATNFSPTRAGPIFDRSHSVAQRSVPLWQCGLVFAFAFALHFNPAIGLGGQTAASQGFNGFRVIDVLSFGAVLILGAYSVPRRILPVAFYALIMGTLFAMPTLSNDQQTAVLAYRYLLYSLAALYVLVIINEAKGLEWFCWGLIIGLVATIPIYVIQDSVYASKLVEWGLTPPYTNTVFSSSGDFLRYSGLSSHPNDAGHTSALAAAAGAYFVVVRRKFLPIVIVSAALLAVFYYTRSRGGLFAGGAIIAFSLLASQGRVNVIRLGLVLGFVVIAMILVSQIDFIAARFSDDADQSNNIAERLGTTLAGLQVLLTNPFGLPIDEFSSDVVSASGGIGTPHNGFIFFGGIFGLFPLLALLVTFAVNLRARTAIDVFFLFLTLQVAVSFMFEQLPASCSYEFAICLLMGRAYFRTRLGNEFTSGHFTGNYERPFRPLLRDSR